MVELQVVGHCVGGAPGWVELRWKEPSWVSGALSGWIARWVELQVVVELLVSEHWGGWSSGWWGTCVGGAWGGGALGGGAPGGGAQQWSTPWVEHLWKIIGWVEYWVGGAPGAMALGGVGFQVGGAPCGCGSPVSGPPGNSSGAHTLSPHGGGTLRVQAPGLLGHRPPVSAPVCKGRRLRWGGDTVALFFIHFCAFSPVELTKRDPAVQILLTHLPVTWRR